MTLLRGNRDLKVGDVGVKTEKVELRLSPIQLEGVVGSWNPIFKMSGTTVTNMILSQEREQYKLAIHYDHNGEPIGPHIQADRYDERGKKTLEKITVSQAPRTALFFSMAGSLARKVLPDLVVSTST